MATQKVNFKGKLGGQLIEGNLLSDQDIQSIKNYQNKTDTIENNLNQLQQQVENTNKFQRKIATKDYYTDETHKSEMEINVIYMVAFKGSKFIAPAASGSTFWTDGEVPELFQLVRKAEDDTVYKLGTEKYSPDLDGVLSKTADNTFTGFMKRAVADNSFNDTDSVAYMTQFTDYDATQNPTKQAFSGHLALDKNNVKLYAHTGTVKKDGTRQASLGVYSSAGSGVGEIVVQTNSEGSKIDALAPQTREDSPDNAIVTKGFLNIKMTNNVAIKYQGTDPGEVADDNTLIFFPATNKIAN